MRWLVVVVLLAGCNAGGLAPIDSQLGDDVVPIDANLTIDGAVIDARLIDAEIYDAEIYDAEVHDAEVIPDAEVYDAEPEPDAHDPLVDSLTIDVSGFAGSYSVSPPGTSCGEDCVMYPAPTEVTITLTLVPGANLSWGLGPCAPQAHAPTCTIMVTGEVIQGVDFFCPTFVVDVVNGSDDNVGTCGAPFKTITKAASIAHDFQIIRLLPGTYSDATEDFPIDMPDGTPLWGAELDHGAGIIITTTGPSAITCGLNSDLAGLTVSATGGTAITADVPCIIRDSVIHDSATGIAISSTGVRVERNTITANAVGVSITADGADLGSSTAGGDNELTCNGAADVMLADGVDATAVACSWDHDPPSAADIGLGTGATLDVSNNTLVSSPCP